MKKTHSQAIVILLAFLAASCASHKKFDYHNAYKFDRINYNKSTVTDPSEQMNESMIVTNITSTPGDFFADLKPIAPQHLDIPQRLSTPEYTQQDERSKITHAYKAMTRTEKRAFRKELRQTIRDLKNENLSNEELTASIKGITDVQDDGNSQKKRKIAKYLLIGGGALVIIAVIVGSFSVVGTIGVVAIIAGAVLMLLSLDK